MRKLLNRIFLFAFLFFINNAQAQINVTTGHNATKLAEMLVGTGVKILNAKYNGVSTVDQRGKFFSTNGALPFDSGVVLSTGNVKTGGTKTGVNGNQSNDASFSVYPTSTLSGDVDLEWLLNNTGAPKTHDACVLEFDLIPSGDSINISYIFSSEEYSNWVCSQYNDVFGFFLTGYGIIGRKNLALVPNSIPNNNIPVSINSINNGIPSGSNPITTCQATGIGAPYTSMYQDNSNGQHLTHYGRTKELVARYKVTPCKTYHLRLAIADFSDGILDSGIFLKAGSIKSEPQASLKLSNTYIDSNKDVLVERCHTRGYVKVERNKKLDTTKALTLNFTFSGDATYGVDYTSPTFINFAPYQTIDSLPIDIFDDGIGDDNEIIWVKILPPCAGVPIDSIAIKVKEYWTYTSTSIDTLCYPSMKQIKSLFADSTYTSFLWNTGDTTKAIFATTNGIYNSVATYKNTCYQKDTFAITVDSLILNNTIKNFSTCSLDSVTLSFTTNQPVISHLWSNGSADSIIKVGATGNYIMTCTTPRGCIAKDTSFIKYISIPILSLLSTADFCSGDSVLLTASNDLGLKYKWNTGDSSNAIWVKNSGTYSVVAQANGCIVYDTTIVTSKPNPSVNLPANISKCKGETVWLNASTLAGSICTWSNGSNTDSIAVTTTDRYIVNVNLNGCFATDTSDVIFYDIPVLNLPAIVNFCAGDSIVLNAATFAGTSYLWSTGDTTSSIVVKANGTYTIKAVLGVCSAYDTTIVNVTQYPTLNLQTNISSCKGDSVLLDATNITGTIYTWNTGETTPTIWIKNTGTYYVDASINGCGAKDTSVAIFNNTPVLNLPITKNICASDSALLNATTYAGTKYLWNTGDTTATIYVKANGSYSVKASLGVCDAYDTTVINVTQYPTLNLQTNISSCKGDSVLLDATNAAGTIYTWSNGVTTPTLWIKNSGTYIVKADINSCVTRDTSVAIFNNTPILNLPAVKNICEGDSAVLNATTYFGTSYFWSTGAITSAIKVKTNGTYFVKASLGVCDAYDTTVVNVTQYQQLSLPANISACQGDTFLLDASAATGTVYIWSNGATTPTITINNSGTYVVNASLNGCSTRDTTEAIFNYTPILNLPAKINFCEGDSALLNATTYTGTNYLWNTGATTPTLNVKTSGTYSVKASLGVCNATDSTIVNVTQYQILNLPPTVVGCAGDSVFLDATSATGTLYTWSNGATTPTLWVKADGSYRVTASLNGCPTRDTSTILFNIPPTVTVQPSFASFCDGDSVLLTASSNMAASQFLWNTNDATNTLLVKVSGEFLVDVKANGCTTRGVANVIAYPIPTVDAGKDLYIMQGDKEMIKATASNDVNTFTWTPSIGLDNATILQPEIINPIETTYKLTVSNGHCSNFDTVKIIVLGSFKIPNAFSPNGDGVNDFWEIKGMEKYKTVDVNVFDRYGRKVYETSGYSTAWDGTHKGTGKPLPIGVYYYIIDAKRGIPPFVGSVTIIR